MAHTAAVNSASASLPWVVVGGGMVGASMALAIADSGRSVVILEPFPETSFSNENAYDLRISAITDDNIALLKQLQVWQPLQDLRVQAFHQLAVQEQGGEWLTFGDLVRPPLGYMIENRALQQVLTERLQQHPQVRYVAEGFAQVQQINKQWQVITSGGAVVPYQYLVAADGVRSQVRQAVGIGTIGARYQERCLLAVVKMAQRIPAATWQTFAGSEVHALLPLADDHACLIVYANPSTLASWQQDTISEQLEQRFQATIGAFKVLNFASFPLQHQHALRYWQAERAALLIGDAAHGIHPLAGQGVNLGLRDVAALATLLQQQPNDDAVFTRKLQRVLKRRQAENLLMGQGLDTISRVFRAQHPLLQGGRRLGFAVLARSEKLRNWVGKLAGG